MSRCPYCLEEITPGALICKHCGSPIRIPGKKRKIPFWRGTFMLGLYSGIMLMVLLIILYNRIF